MSHSIIDPVWLPINRTTEIGPFEEASIIADRFDGHADVDHSGEAVAAKLNASSWGCTIQVIGWTCINSCCNSTVDGAEAKGVMHLYLIQSMMYVVF